MLKLFRVLASAYSIDCRSSHLCQERMNGSASKWKSLLEIEHARLRGSVFNLFLFHRQPLMRYEDDDEEYEQIAEHSSDG